MYKDLIDILRNNQLACLFGKNETAAYLLKSNGNRNKYPPITKKVTTLHTSLLPLVYGIYARLNSQNVPLYRMGRYIHLCPDSRIILMKTSGPVYFLGLTYTSIFGVILTLILHS